MKIILKTNGELLKTFLFMTVMIVPFSIIMMEITEERLYLTLSLIPFVLFIVAYRGTYYPLLRKVEKELELENKYQYFYSKFLNKI